MTLIHHWPKKELPRERLKAKGAGALGDAELLAILLGTGTRELNVVDSARSILNQVGKTANLSRQTLRSLSNIPGIGEAKAARIIAAIELGTRIVEQSAGGTEYPRFSCSADIWRHFRTRLAPLTQENVVAVGVNNKNEPICEYTVAKGTLVECTVGPREIFRPMIAEAAARVILLHNHPSGDPNPSGQDIALTRRLVQVGQLVGIELLDHLIFGRSDYISFKDLGLLNTG